MMGQATMKVDAETIATAIGRSRRKVQQDTYPDIATKWQNAGDLPERLQRAQDVAQAAVWGLDVETQTEFLMSFDGLPDGAQAAILSEISLPPAGYVKEATAEQVELFGSTPEGAAILKKLGGANSHKAARAAGLIRAKMDRAVKSMSPEDREAFGTWYDNLTPQEAYTALLAVMTV